MATPAGIVVVVHGGREVSMRPVTPVDLPVLRMIPVARAIQRAVGGTGIAVWRHRFAVRGWNGGQASPAGDLTRLLDDIRARYDSVPVFVAGHSMGARAAFRAAGHPAVCAVAGLAPWLPAGKPVGQLAGRRVLLAHGSADTVPIPGRQRPSGWRLDGACCQRPPLPGDERTYPGPTQKYKNRQRAHRRRHPHKLTTDPDSRRSVRGRLFGVGWVVALRSGDCVAAGDLSRGPGTGR